MVPASIRTKNPSAMWPGQIATKFGSTQYETLHDGQGNKIAIFPDYEHGAAAQFALWAHSYAGMTLEAAIYKWSGHNSSTAYAQSLAKHVPGLSMSTVITVPFLQSAQGLQFMKFQAQWEAGQVYPMTDQQWATGQKLAFGEAQKEAEPKPSKAPQKPETAPEVAEATPQDVADISFTKLKELI